MLIIVRPEVYINTCDECSELRAYLSYGHWPVPRCPDKGSLSVYMELSLVSVRTFVLKD